MSYSLSASGVRELLLAARSILVGLNQLEDDPVRPSLARGR